MLASLVRNPNNFRCHQAILWKTDGATVEPRWDGYTKLVVSCAEAALATFMQVVETVREIPFLMRLLLPAATRRKDLDQGK
ncbi:uncharacterized protein UV8b_00030 [Ustilaginoidea virens]|uniref:Uncharacterized protein n=1 Tax=Ustilaginoidea virens TaxID=1159556 RepID=A0A8E5HI33_USTVR|nr:uncharacterized protein UV8b_00030 [Ustilaginoidea virens]QUC15789.1 hypothetical protein UV8b_00030 [Ustilaginoidea virens]